LIQLLRSGGIKMDQNERIYPALATYEATHAVPEEARRVPVAGVIGAGGCERLFCKLAHQAAGDPASVTVDDIIACSMLRHSACRLTGCTHRCLFMEPEEHSYWDRLRRAASVVK